MRITPSWTTQSIICQADKEGRWLAVVSTFQTGFTPYEITFDNGEPLTLRNVLVGEIIRSTDYPDIRFFIVSTEQAYDPQDDCKGSWQQSSVHTSAEFSATIWYFATSLQKALYVPVGVIVVAYGGVRLGMISTDGMKKRRLCRIFTNTAERLLICLILI